MAESDAQRASELLCCSRKQPKPVVVLQRGAMALAKVAQATQPARLHELGEVHQLHRPLLPVDQDTTPAALSPFRRQNPRDEPGALAAHAGIRAGGGWQQPLLPRPSLISFPVLRSYHWRLRSSVTRPSWTMRLVERSSGPTSPRFSCHRRTRAFSSWPMMMRASEPPMKERRSRTSTRVTDLCCIVILHLLGLLAMLE